MQVYLFPIKTGFILFPFIALFFTFPFAIYQYKKYGYLNKLRIFILYSFLLYLMIAYFLVILPLPETRDVRSLQSSDTKHYNLILFRFIFNIMNETQVVLSRPSTYKLLLTEKAFLQVAFNGILLTPLGIYLRYYFKKNLKTTLFLTLMVSLFFEITQITALFGLYNAPYRILDVDDLFLNTLGGYIGYLIAPIFTFFLPNTSEIDDDINPKNLKVSYFRRALAYSIDMFLIKLILDIRSNIIFKGLIIFVYFILVVYFTNGKTVGKWLTNLRVEGQSNRLTFKEAFIRYGILYFGVLGLNDLLNNTISLNQTISMNYFIIIVTLLQLIVNLLLGLHVVLCIIKKDRFFYEKISKTHITISSL